MPLLSLRSLMQNRRGANLGEYALLAGTAAFIALGAVSVFVTHIQEPFRDASQRLSAIGRSHRAVLEGGDGLQLTPLGFDGGAISGWVSNNGFPFTLRNSGDDGMINFNQGKWLDMGASYNAMDISRTTGGLSLSGVYQLIITAGDRSNDLSNRIDVYWSGQLIGSIKPDIPNLMEDYVFHISEGSGDGTNTLRLVEKGSADTGMSLGEVRLWGI